MRNQTVSIDLKFMPDNEFRILNVYLSRQNELIVVSKYSPHYAAFSLAYLRYLHTEPQAATVSVKEELPVKHYIFGLPDDYKQEWLPTCSYTRIGGQQGMPADEKVVCLYENPYTEEQEVNRKIEYYQRELSGAKYFLREYQEDEIKGELTEPGREATAELECVIETKPKEIAELQKQLAELKVERNTFRPSWWTSNKNAVLAGALGLFAVGSATVMASAVAMNDSEMPKL